MIIGVPTEIKPRENRFGINPGGVQSLVLAGHVVKIQSGAGVGSGVSDDELKSVGATIVPTAADAWDADMVMKVKEPLQAEFQYFRPGLILYTYLHLAPLPELTKELMDKKVRAIAYETIEAPDGTLPLLRPMSEVAGRMAVQVGAASLEKERGGKGILLGGVPGTRRGRVAILGGGVVGSNAARIAVGMGAHVTVLDVNHERMAYLEDIFQGAIETLYSNPKNIKDILGWADLVVGAVLVAGARAPHLVKREDLKLMGAGSVIVDVAVDQGGCIETCRPTTHDQPTFVLDDVVHYCVPNMPGAVAQTSTFALTNVTLKYAERIARLGVEAAVKADLAGLGRGVNCWDGACTYEAVAQGVGAEFTPLDRVLG
ncbi:MAG: alanine dehydrogenase [Sandaracinus sp.]|nr:alanine dehydrogenase [Sandaracinus sp.]MCB9614710.1 alanine dehydrogenase [Sandaracinus sp.]MCB9632318.1 alanine dehydrogenase [Sandaracinus sp.]